MITIERARAELFRSRWRWLHSPDWDAGGQYRYPGVYLLAYDARELAGKRVAVDDVYYIGMSNSAGGVRARLKQFKSALEKGYGHSGGDRCYRRNKQTPFSQLRSRKRFYFAAWCVPSTSPKASARPLVACLEYYAIGHVLTRTGKVPPLNISAGGILVRA